MSIMIRKLKTILLVCGVLAASLFVFYSATQSKQQVSELFIYNIEALADDEGIPVMCAGIGELDCLGHKVSIIVYNFR